MAPRKRKRLRVVSWNVNGLRAAGKKGFVEWLGRCGGQVVGVQEVRATADQLTPELRRPKGWHSAFVAAEKKGYSGVGLYARDRPNAVETSLGVKSMDAEGRLQLARFGALWIANVYFPNGSGTQRDHSRVPFKLKFYRRLFDLLEERKAAGAPILVMGDFNTAHREVDLARPKANSGTSGFLPRERRELDRWLKSDWVDTWRHLHPDTEGVYTWWSQRFGVRARNVGWRIDYVLASPGALPFLRAATVHGDVLGSDHCPISVDLDGAVLV